MTTYGKENGGTVFIVRDSSAGERQSLFRVNGPFLQTVSFLSPILFLVLWEVLARTGLIDIRLFSAPSLIIKAMVPMVTSGELLFHTAVSLRRVLLGFLVGALPGLLLGLSMGLFPLVRSLLNPLVAATFPIPKLVIMPLILLIFGLGETSKVVIIALGVFYLVLINTLAGVLNIEPIYMDVAKNFGAGRREFYLTVALPGAMPMIFAGFKVGMGTALLLFVAAEMSAARAGIGWMIWRAYDVFDIEKMFAGLITTSVLGFLLSYALDFLERFIIPWKEKK